ISSRKDDAQMLKPLTRAVVTLTAAAALTGTALTSAAGIARASSRAFPAPFGRVWESWAYDPAQHNIVLFGGATARGGGNDGIGPGRPWTWNGRWTERHPARSPRTRTGAAIVYDAATRQLLLFGGSVRSGTGGGFFGDTWVWNGRTWNR